MTMSGVGGVGGVRVAVIPDDDVIIESSSSGPGTPAAPPSNPETPRPAAEGAAAPGAAGDSSRGGTPPPPSATRIAAATGSMVAPPPLGAFAAGAGVPPGASKYSQLLAVIEEMGRDIRPTYAGGKTSAERLKRSIMHARILVRECLMECDRAARS